MVQDYKNLAQDICYLQEMEQKGTLSPQTEQKIISSILMRLLQKLCRSLQLTVCTLTKPENFEDTKGITSVPTHSYLKRERWLTVAEAAELLENDPALITRLANNGELLSNGKHGKDRRISFADILLFQHKRNQNRAKQDDREVRRDKKKMDKFL